MGLDLGGTFGRVRLVQYLAVTVEEGVVTRIESNGRIEDLYDFNFEVPGLPGRVPATVQLGYSTRVPSGRIFGTAVVFNRVWTSNPCPP